jgi:hypothetical protein
LVGSVGRRRFNRALSGGTPAREEVELFLGVASRFGSVGDKGEAFAGQFQCIARELDVADE